MVDPLIRARSLRKTFDDLVAVDDIDVEVHQGEAFGFLGPNGAGKSSTMRMIGCVSPRSGGELSVLGLDPDTHAADIKARLGVVPQEDTLDKDLTVDDNLLVYGRYFDLPRRVIAERAAELLDFVQLTDRRRTVVEHLSGGMVRRLTIARALINEPELVLLDEPTTGLDPQARHLLWDRLYGLREQGVTLVITTHYMDEAEQLCDRLVIMDGGRIVAEGAPSSLIRHHCTREVVELRFGAGGQADATGRLTDWPGRTEVVADRILVYADHGDDALRDLHARGIEPQSALVRRAGLEDVFLGLTGRQLVD